MVAEAGEEKVCHGSVAGKGIVLETVNHTATRHHDLDLDPEFRFALSTTSSTAPGYLSVQPVVCQTTPSAPQIMS